MPEVDAKRKTITRRSSEVRLGDLDVNPRR
jgi:hypothetical protein